MTSTAITPFEQQSQSTLLAISKAAENPDVDVEKMQALLDMQERIMDKAAHAAYTAAIHAFQAECPQLPKTKEIRVKGRLQSSYCPFEDMMRIVRPIMIKHGLTEQFDSEDGQGRVQVHCKLSHKDGHSEVSKFAAPFDQSGNKNSVQAVASSISYGKRYSLASALGLVFEEEDDDAESLNGPDPAPIAAKKKARRPEQRAQLVNDVEGRMEADGISDNEVNDALVKLGAVEEKTDWRNLSDSVVAHLATEEGFRKIVTATFEEDA